MKSELESTRTHCMKSYLQSSRKVGSAWHGYNDIRREGHWTWANPSGRCKHYTHWNRGEPNGKRHENCGQLYSNGRWNDLSCKARLASVCEYGSRSKKLCKHRGHHHGSKHHGHTFTVYGVKYEIIKKKMTWGQAQHNCRKRGGNLATIINSKVNSVVTSHVRKR